MGSTSSLTLSDKMEGTALKPGEKIVEQTQAEETASDIRAPTKFVAACS